MRGRHSAAVVLVTLVASTPAARDVLQVARAARQSAADDLRLIAARAPARGRPYGWVPGVPVIAEA